MDKKDRHSSVYSAMSSDFENELNKGDDEIKKEMMMMVMMMDI